MNGDLSIVFNFIAAFALFLFVNWLGKHSASFGYRSVTLFEDADESLALNFIIRTLPPSILILFLSALFVSFNLEEYRIGVYWIALIYYAIRAAYYFIFDIWRLVNWPRFFVQSFVGIICALIVYRQLVLPMRSLMPDLESAGTEIWFSIVVFIYAVANQVHVKNLPNARRKNKFIARKFQIASDSYGNYISSEVSDRKLQLAIYAIIIYEGYCRPWIVRFTERIVFWKDIKSTGIMQISSAVNLTDGESVRKGVAMMLSSWNSQGGKSESIRIGRAVSDFNRDDNYISNVYSVMEIIAKRTDRSFASEFDGLDYYEFSYGTPISSEISQNTQKPNIQKLRLLIRARKK